MPKRKILSYEDLEKFYFQFNKNMSFSSEESGYQLAIHVPMQFSTVEESDDGTRRFYDIRAFHLLKNRNGSSVPKSAADKAMKNMAYQPVLANFITYTDPNTGEQIEDFTSHDMTWVPNSEEENGGHYEYIEHQIGCFTADAPYYEETDDKTYIRAKICIPNEYTSANSIIERKGGTKLSVELIVNALQYNAKDKVLELTDIVVQGITCLGTKLDGDGNPVEVQEGMQGAGITLEDFSTENNSVFSHIDENDTNKLFELLSSINSKLDKFENINNQKEGGQIQNMTKFEELLQKYNKTVEDVTFDYEGLSDDELEAVFAENFGEAEPSNDPEPEPTEPEPTDPVEPEGGNDPIEPTTVVNSSEPMIRTYEISHEDTRYALYALLQSYEDADNEWYFINNVFDSYFTYENWNGNKVYGQAYTKDGDNVAFDGERYNLHRELLTDSEYAELQSMRSNYASIKEKADKYDYSVLESERVAEFAKIDYSSISDKQEFVELAKEENHKDFSLDEVKSKLNDIILSYAKAGQLSFAATTNEPDKKIKVTRLPLNDGKSAKRSRYGNLFSKEQ